MKQNIINFFKKSVETKKKTILTIFVTCIASIISLEVLATIVVRTEFFQWDLSSMKAPILEGLLRLPLSLLKFLVATLLQALGAISGITKIAIAIIAIRYLWGLRKAITINFISNRFDKIKNLLLKRGNKETETDKKAPLNGELVSPELSELNPQVAPLCIEYKDN